MTMWLYMVTGWLSFSAGRAFNRHLYGSMIVDLVCAGICLTTAWRLED